MQDISKHKFKYEELYIVPSYGEWGWEAIANLCGQEEEGDYV